MHAYGAWLLQLNAQVSDPVSYVNTLVGTNSKFELSTGNTYPAVAMPWGMNFWSAQTGKMGDGWMYTYTADKIRGFKQTHQPSPWMNDYGQFSLMPTTGKPVFDENERAQLVLAQSRSSQALLLQSTFGRLRRNNGNSSNRKSGYLPFHIPRHQERVSSLPDAFDKGSSIKIIPEENKIVGYTTRNSGGVPDNFKSYFVIVFDKPFTYSAAVKDGKITEGEKAFKGNHAGAIIGFSTSDNEQVHARVASSFISEEQAIINLKELGDASFDKVVSKGKQRWNEVLGKINVEDDNIDNLRTFYSCFYRSVLFPRNFSEQECQW